MTLHLTDEESKALLQLIDLAIKSAGLQAADAGLFLARKVSAARAEVASSEDVDD